MKTEELARFYFQDKLSKFCPADKTERPNGFEKAMFRYGLEHTQKENARLREALEHIVDEFGDEYSYIRILARKALKGGE
jgi:hypothetical protein